VILNVLDYFYASGMMECWENGIMGKENGSEPFFLI
jgi:hypothetical protein